MPRHMRLLDFPTCILLLTGCEGQLGRSFSEHWSRSDAHGRYKLINRAEPIDIRSEAELLNYLADLRPAIVNAATYTRVDEAGLMASLRMRLMNAR